MPRPNKEKQLAALPRPVIYMPSGWSRQHRPAAEISVEDFEACRLVDAAGCNLEEAARKLNCSRSTAGRMLQRARRILAQAISEKALFCIDAGADSKFTTVQPQIGPRGEWAAAVESEAPDSLIFGIFGRAPYFAIGKPGQPGFSFIPNPGRGLKRGAAKAAAQVLREAGVNRVAAGRFGPDALLALAAANIEPLLLNGLHLSDFQP